MITLTLQQLQSRLQRELPAYHWHCQPVDHAPCIAGTDLPLEIQVSATQSGCALSQSFYISGNMLVRWGMDSSARLICNEMSPRLRQTRLGLGSDWDKLSEA